MANAPVHPDFPFASTIDTVSSLLISANKPNLLKPRVGIVCGSGLSTLASHLRDKIEVPYSQLPGFGHSSGSLSIGYDWIIPTDRDLVPGHKSALAFGLIGPDEGVPVVVMLGRVRLEPAFWNDRGD